MTASVHLEDLVSAYEWLTAADAAGTTASAFINRTTGTIHWVGEGADEDVPDDIDDGTLYLAVPRQRDLDLGRSLALRFAEEHLPDAYDQVCAAFDRGGAYGRFKGLLERAGLLEAWHRYEEAATEQALRDWCRDRGLTATP